MDMARAQREEQLAAQEHQFKMQEMAAKAQIQREQMALEQARVKLEAIQLNNKLAFEERRHKMKMESVSKSEPESAA